MNRNITEYENSNTEFDLIGAELEVGETVIIYMYIRRNKVKENCIEEDGRVWGEKLTAATVNICGSLCRDIKEHKWS